MNQDGYNDLYKAYQAEGGALRALVDEQDETTREGVPVWLWRAIGPP